MVNSFVEPRLAKIFIFIMAVLTLLQGLLYLAVSIKGLSLNRCLHDPHELTEKPFEFVFKLIYFVNQDCKNPTVWLPSQEQFRQINFTDWSKSTAISNRTNSILVFYADISIFWILTSVLVLYAVFNKFHESMLVLCYWPWTFVILLGSGLDFIATKFSLVDVSYTETARKAFKYIGASVNDNELLEYLSEYDYYFIMTTNIIIAITTRGVILWFINIFGVIAALQMANILRYWDAESEYRRYVVPHLGRVPSGKEDFNLKNEQIKEWVSQQTTLAAEEMDLPVDEKSESSKSPKFPTVPMSVRGFFRSVDELPGELIQSVQKNVLTKPVGRCNSLSTYRHSESHPDNLNYPTEINAGVDSGNALPRNMGRCNSFSNYYHSESHPDSLNCSTKIDAVNKINMDMLSPTAPIESRFYSVDTVLLQNFLRNHQDFNSQEELSKRSSTIFSEENSYANIQNANLDIDGRSNLVVQA